MTTTRQRLLELLLDSDGPVSGPALATSLSISRAGVWKQIETLREDGFHIPSTDQGYVLESIPETGSDALEIGLDAPYSIEYHDSLPSTNERARELADSGETEVAVVASTQTAGRGRLDRSWESPPGGIYCSVLFRPALSPLEAPLYTLAAAVATTETMRSLDIDARIKWPNDVLVGKREAKVAGILTEMQGETDKIDWMIVGIGINVDTPPVENATGLEAEFDGTIDRRTVIQSLLERFSSLQAEPEQIVPAWRTLTSTLGRTVRVHTASETIEGTATDVESPGVLLVESNDQIHRIHAGDCEHLRPVTDRCQL